MMAAPPDDLPITGLCVVADPSKCPPGYDLLYYSEDKKDDCDLWKDSFFKSRVMRYLCVTRIFPLDGGRLNNVLADLVIQNEKDLPPTGYTLVENTVDTSEKATRKKQICVRLIPRNTTQQAISKLIILSKSKRAPADYTLAGEINGLLVCFKYGEVPASKTSPTSSGPRTPGATSLEGSRNSSYFKAGVPPPIETQMSINTSQSAPQKPNNNLHAHPLTGVPFQINPKYSTGSNITMPPSCSVSYRSFVDIENEYTYPFRLERSTIGKGQ